MWDGCEGIFSDGDEEIKLCTIEEREFRKRKSVEKEGQVSGVELTCLLSIEEKTNYREVTFELNISH